MLLVSENMCIYILRQFGCSWKKLILEKGKKKEEKKKEAGKAEEPHELIASTLRRLKARSTFTSRIVCYLSHLLKDQTRQTGSDS